jgi:hypothetical protein
VIVLPVRNAHEALPKGVALLLHKGIMRNSRNGPVLVAPEPVATVYEKPTERVVHWPERDANPFFHLYESLWMLAGRRDVAPLTRYVKRMAEFSDDGENFNAAYGYRWRGQLDQVRTISLMLKKNPDDRRCVLQIWNQYCDFYGGDWHMYDGKDAACNVAATFQVDPDGYLNMIVFCRSNDMIWGAYGANAVHFSMLQEYVARRAGYRVGSYTQISVNYHAYVERQDWGRCLTLGAGTTAERFPHPSYPIAAEGANFDDWDKACKMFVTPDGRLPSGLGSWWDPFFLDVASPVVRAHDVYQDSGKSQVGVLDAIDVVQSCQDMEWRVACTDWLKRRLR